MTGLVVIFGIVLFIVGGTWLSVRPFFQDEMWSLSDLRLSSSATPPAITWIPQTKVALPDRQRVGCPEWGGV